MKKLFVIIFAITAILPMMAKGEKGIAIKKIDGETLHIGNSAIKSMTFVDGNALLTAETGATIEIPRSDIDLISSVDKIATEYTVKYDGTSATVINPYVFRGVTTTIDGGYVTTTNPNESEELTFTLSGTTDNGGYVYNGSYKCTLQLNAVSINSQRGAAIDVKCSKRIAVVLVEGTVNTLADYAEGSQKAALYFKGHVDAAGNVLMSYLCPVSMSSATIVSTSPQYGNNSACKLVYGATAVDNPTETLLDGQILIGGTLTGGTNKSITPKTK